MNIEEIIEEYPQLTEEDIRAAIAYNATIVYNNDGNIREKEHGERTYINK
jgi:uncharacterized protein (DUF433 family)